MVQRVARRPLQRPLERAPVAVRHGHAIVHALVYGSNDFGALAELDKRLRFMGLTFED